MSKLNQLICANQVANTGFGSCFLDMEQIIGAFIVPNGYSLTAAELLAIQASLTADKKVATKLARIYPVHGFVGVESGTEDKTVQSFPYGGKKVVREGDYDWTFQFTEGGLPLHKALRSFNSNGAWSILFYDEKFRLFGTTGSVAGSLYGIPLKMLWANPWTPNDGSNTAMYKLQVVFEPRYINDALGYAEAGSYLLDVKGLQDAIITKNSWNESTGVVNISIQTQSGTDLSEVYPTELALTAVYKASNASTGAAITISSAVFVSATKSFNVTLATGDSDWPATTEGIIFDLAANSTLESNGIVDFESAGTITLPTT